MPERQPKNRVVQRLVASPWRVPVAVDDIPEAGLHFDLAADGDVRSVVARLASLRDLPRLEAAFDVKRHAEGGLRVAGRVSATVGQNCVVTLEPLASDIEEEVDLLFVPQQQSVQAKPEGESEHVPHEAKWNDPEPLVDGVVDLGALATEFLILGIDPYPRKPGAVFQPPSDNKPDSGPFAALAGLTKGRNDY
jgi:Large ribosomal RNA subunit accumulation protein YceD